MKRLIFILIATGAIMTSCMRADDVKVLDFDDVVVHSPTRIDLLLTVQNDSRRNIEIATDAMTVAVGDKQLLTIRFTEPVVIPKRSSGQVVVPMRLRLTDPLAVLTLMNNESALELLNLSGEVKVKAGSTKKTFKLQKYPILKNLRKLGVDTDHLDKKLNL